MNADQPVSGPFDAPGPRILLVEDEPTIQHVVRDYLLKEGFVVDTAGDGFAALHLAQTHPPDLVILDRMLPGLDGTEVCRRIRANREVPIIMLTALGTADDRIQGLELGADDYVTKPFSPRELVLRVKSVLRRSAVEPQSQAPVHVANFTLNPGAHTVTRQGVALSLTTREYELLAFLLQHPDRVFTREELIKAVWGWNFGDLSTVTVHVRRVREKIEADPTHPVLLQTVWGVGYRFTTAPVNTSETGARHGG
ncbi:response regulator transcription factor [Arthrobacter sp. H5]|uniref:response regulator transcription factor n=1 Tax=Arthrobacter sp. H5 TaxID=1267973 RepID=UPI0006871EC5|nr:response regulator transcription factor [Arthrobacter sp. H5]